jgi:hypothetical protein
MDWGGKMSTAYTVQGCQPLLTPQAGMHGAIPATASNEDAAIHGWRRLKTVSSWIARTVRAASVNPLGVTVLAASAHSEQGSFVRGDSEVDLFGNFEGLVDLNAEVANGAFNPGVAEATHGPCVPDRPAGPSGAIRTSRRSGKVAINCGPSQSSAITPCENVPR